MATFSRSLLRAAVVGGAVIAVTLGIANLPGVAQQSGEWPNITGGYSATRYLPLDQINANNFNTLKVAWEWRGEVPPGVELGDINARGLPIYVDNLLYTTSGPRRTVVALDPVKTGFPSTRPSAACRNCSSLLPWTTSSLTAGFSG